MFGRADFLILRVPLSMGLTMIDGQPERTVFVFGGKGEIEETKINKK